MNLKANFNKDEISKAFNRIKDKLPAMGVNVMNDEKLFGQKANLRNAIHTFLEREKAIWAELGYAETFARGVDAWDRMNTRRIFAAGGALLAVGMIAFTVHVATQPNAFSLEINGVPVGYVEAPEIVDEAVADLKLELLASEGVSNVVIGEDVIACTATREKKLNLLDEEEIQEAVLEADVCQLDAWAVTVNGERIVAAATQEAADQILADVADSYKSEGSEIISFGYKEDVEVEPCTVGVGEIMPSEQAVTFILTGSEEPQTYTVVEGDTLWDIAFANGMKPAELVAANPDFEPDKLKIGQVLNLVAVKPYLTVTMTEKLTAREAIPFETIYEDKSTLTRGKTEVKTAGVNGQKEVVSQVVKENGKVVASTVLNETVLSEPVAQVAYRGTKTVVLTASARGSGVLGSPLSSVVPSQNGGMYGASRGGRRHVGVDLRSSKGAPIYAADSGTVTKVSSNGSYGKLIVVSHGNGLTTKYAHCNSIGVSVGQKVQKGEQIGTVGNTGNATGYILHFEVLVNGTNVNPLNYL